MPGICCQSISVVQIKRVSCTPNKLTLKKLMVVKTPKLINLVLSKGC